MIALINVYYIKRWIFIKWILNVKKFIYTHTQIKQKKTESHKIIDWNDGGIPKHPTTQKNWRRGT